MHSFRNLPLGYIEHLQIDLQKNKKLAFRVNAISAVIMLAMLAVGHFLMVPVWTLLFDGPVPADTTVPLNFVKPLVMLGGMMVYIVLHELTHAAAMKCFGARKIRFGFTGLYAYAGSEQDYFDRRAYVTVALAPMIFWGIVFSVLMYTLPQNWFWVVYFWQVANVSGSAGDMYVSILTAKMPLGVVAKDTGVAVTFYCPAE